MVKKKKKGSALVLADSKLQAIRHRKNFNERIEKVCDLFAGPGYFKKLKPFDLDYLYTNRYPVIKGKVAADAQLPKAKVAQFNKLMSEIMGNEPITLQNGNDLLLSLYLTEGLALINYVEYTDEYDRYYSAELNRAFEPYFWGTPQREELEELVSGLSNNICLLLSDYNDTLIRVDILDLVRFHADSEHTELIIYVFETERTVMVIDGHKRELLRLGWVTTAKEWMWAAIKPSFLGFKTGAMEMPVEVYIQAHALKRLQERVNITPGIMHYVTFLTFQEEYLKHHSFGGRSLIEFRLSNLKVGYLVVSLTQARLVIHTFLFLTNDKTPEGNKLAELTAMERSDKKYLMIDNLPTFNSYHIDQNEKLSKLFRDAGCGSLLKLGHVQEFSKQQVQDKDPESIVQYLSDITYFQQEEEDDQQEGEDDQEGENDQQEGENVQQEGEDVQQEEEDDQQEGEDAQQEDEDAQQIEGEGSH